MSAIDYDLQRMAADSICHAAHMAQLSWQQAAYEYERPCVLFKPKLYPDGNMWCALYGENIQDGVAGFGETPDKAMRQFDIEWLNRKLK